MIGAIVAGLALPGLVVAADDFCLDRALSMVMEGNANLKAARARVEAAEGAVTQAAVWQNPEIALEAEDLGSSGDGDPTYTASIAQPVELGGQRARRGDVARAQADGMRAALTGTEWDLKAETIRRYARWQASIEKRRAAIIWTNIASRLVETTGRRVKAGAASAGDEVRAMADMAAAKAAEAEAVAEMDTAREELARLWGGRAADVPPIGKALFARRAAPDETALAELAAKSPQLRLAETGVQTARSSLRLVQAERRGAVTVTAGLRQETTDDVQSYVAGVSIPLPLFDRKRGGIRQAAAELTAVEAEQMAMQSAVASQLRAALRRLDAKGQQAETLRDQVLPAARRALELVEDGYQNGRFSYVETLDAQRAVLDVWQQLIESVEEYRSTWADIAAMTGTFTLEP